MFNKILNIICPSRKQAATLYQKLQEIEQINEQYRQRIQKLEDTIAAKKTTFATTIDKLSVTSHAIHRYRERHKGKGTDKDIERMLYKCLLQQLATMDTLPDGEYTLRKNVKGRVINNTLVTILPRRDNGSPKLK